MNNITKAPYIISIDDDDDFNNYLSVLLKKCNIRSSITKNPGTFLQKLKKNKPDLCLIDLNLDIASGAGYQIIQAIRNTIEEKIPIFVLSRRTTQEDIQKAFDLGADDFIAKPLDDIIFKAKLEKFLNINGLIDPLPMYSIDEKVSKCRFNSFFTLLEIHEEKFILESSNYLDTGQVFHLEGAILKEVLGTDLPILFSILESRKTEHNNRYVYEASFNTDDEDMRYTCRKWLLHNS